MTTNPPSLLAVRRLLNDKLGIPAIALGIAGDAPHAEGGDSYHLGADQIRPRNGRDRYSVDESPRDKSGLTNFASALDIGEFEVRVAGKVHNLRSFSIWLVAQCGAGTADTRDIREVIYSPDGRTVKRWDRLGRRTAGDSSHTSHTHVSYHRDATKAGRDQTAVYSRYLTHIGLLAGEEPDMAAAEDVYHLLHDGRRPENLPQTASGGVPIAWVVREIGEIQAAVNAVKVDVAALAAKLDGVPGGVTQEMLNEAIRTVMGSVDETPPA